MNYLTVAFAIQINDEKKGYRTVAIPSQYDPLDNIWFDDYEMVKYPQEPVCGIKIDYKVREVKYLQTIPASTMIRTSYDPEYTVLVCGCSKYFSFTPGIKGKEYLKPCLLKLDDGRYTIGFEYKGDKYFFGATIDSSIPGNIIQPREIRVEYIHLGEKGYIIKLRGFEPHILMLSDDRFILVETCMIGGKPASMPFYL